MLKRIEQTMEPMGEKLKDFGSGAKDVLSDPTVLAMLLGGAGAGMTGGYLSSQAKGHPGEDKGKRRKRIIMNALLAGGAGAAAGGLASTAYKSLNTALPADDTDPATSTLSDAARVGGVGAVGYGLHRAGVKAEEPLRKNILASIQDSIERGGNNKTYNGLDKQIANALGSDRDASALFFKEHKDFVNGNSRGLPAGAFTPAKDTLAAGGLQSYNPTDSKFWMNREAITPGTSEQGGLRGLIEKLKGTKVDLKGQEGIGRSAGKKGLFTGTAMGRFGKRIGKHPLLAAGGLTAAALSPEILGALIGSGE